MYILRFSSRDLDTLTLDNKKGRALSDLWATGKLSDIFDIKGNKYRAKDIKSIEHKESMEEFYSPLNNENILREWEDWKNTKTGGSLDKELSFLAYKGAVQ